MVPTTLIHRGVIPYDKDIYPVKFKPAFYDIPFTPGESSVITLSRLQPQNLPPRYRHPPLSDIVFGDITEIPLWFPEMAIASLLKVYTLLTASYLIDIERISVGLLLRKIANPNDIQPNDPSRSTPAVVLRFVLYVLSIADIIILHCEQTPLAICASTQVQLDPHLRVSRTLHAIIVGILTW